jgi:choline dehydrogenase
MVLNKFISCFCIFLIGLTSLQARERVESQESDDIECESSGGSKSNGKKYDYIIVGCGTAGAALARKLSDHSKNSVLVLDAGPNNTHDNCVLESNIFDSIFLNPACAITTNPKYASTYPNILPVLPSVNVPNWNFYQTVNYNSGRMLGGSSAHNFLLAVHGTRANFDAWAAASGNNRWLYDNLFHVIKSVETYTGTSSNPKQRGKKGPIFVTQNPPLPAGSNVIDAIVKVANAPLIPDYNVSPGGDIGTSTFQQFITPPVSPSSIRSFSMNGYLPDAFANPNTPIVVETSYGLKGIGKRKLKIYTNALVSRVRFKGNQAKSVEYNLTKVNKQGKAKETLLVAHAKKKIILCAGAIETAAILQRSGIGDKANLLDPLGIPVIFDNPNVGKFTNQYGPIAQVTGTVPGFIPVQSMINLSDSKGNSPYPNDNVRRIQLLIDAISTDNFLFFGFIMKPKSQGTVNIISRDPTKNPYVLLNIYSDGDLKTFDTDANKAITFLKLVKEIADAAGERVLQPSPDVYAGGDTALFDYTLTNPNLVVASHIIGTTVMGRSPANGVVDGNLHVFGVENLMVADIGVLPVIDGNPCYPAYVVGEEAAKIIQEGAK